MKNVSTFLCMKCSKKFSNYASQIADSKRTFCSKRCWYDYKSENKITWNRGLKGVMKPNSGSVKKGEHKSPKTEFKPGDKVGCKNNLWKG